MASCGTCARETHDEPVIRDPNFKYIQGDVYSLKESVYTPIYDILLHTFSKLDDQSDALRRTQQSLDKLTRTIKGGRPAVIMKDGGDDRQGLMVCVATTYKGEDISKLPLIFRHFSIFIEPNHLPSPSPDHTSHIHALPEWDKENAYIIAWRFPSKATRECVWTAQADGDSKEVRQVFGRHAMEYLVAECTKRKEQWEEMCKDPAMALKLESELRKHVKDRQKEKRVYSGTGSKASTSSLNSLASGIDGPCWRRAMSGPTIPEELEDNVDPGATGHRQEPSPWKVVEKKRTGSTYSLASSCRKKGRTDNRSLKSKQSFTPQSHNGSGVFNFDILRAVRVK